MLKKIEIANSKKKQKSSRFLSSKLEIKTNDISNEIFIEIPTMSTTKSFTNPKKKIEILLHTCPGLHKIKANGCSNTGIHKNKETTKNLCKNLEKLEHSIGPLTEKCMAELLISRKWPIKNLKIH